MDPTGCWEWQGHRFGERGGYGSFYDDGGKLRRAHIVAYELAYGPVPDGMMVCHHCDNPPCVRPMHLFVSTQAGNLADMRQKGRARGGSQHGEDRYNAKLTTGIIEQARRDHALGRTWRTIAAELGCSVACISQAVNGRTWKHLQ